MVFDRKFEGKGYDTNAIRTVNKMLATLHINSSGKITKCSAAEPMKGQDIFNMWPPAPFTDIASACLKCKNVHDVELFLPPDLREWLDNDYEAFRKTQAQSK